MYGGNKKVMKVWMPQVPQPVSSGLPVQADQVTIQDLGNYFASTHVEGALQEIGAGLVNGMAGALALGDNVVDQVSDAWKDAVWYLVLYKGTLIFSAIVNAIHNGTAGYCGLTGIAADPAIGVAPFTVGVDLDAGNFRLKVSMTDSGWSYRVRRQLVIT